MTRTQDESQKTESSKQMIEDQWAKFGSMLKALREAKGLTLKDVVHLTRISHNFVVALEAGQLNILPGKAFGRGFIKNICKTLEADPTELLNEYERCLNLEEEKIQIEKKQKKATLDKLLPEGKSSFSLIFKRKSIEKIPFSITNVLKLLAVPLAVVTVGFGVWYYFENKEIALVQVHQEQKEHETAQNNQETDIVVQSTDTQNQNATSTQSPTAASINGQSPEEGSLPPLKQGEEVNQAAVLQPKPQMEPQATVTQQHGTVTVAGKKSNEEGPKNIVLKVKQPVEIKVTIDDGSSTTTVYQPGSYNFSFSKRIDLFVDNTDLVDIEFNNQKLEKLKEHGTRRKLSFVAGSPSVGQM